MRRGAALAGTILVLSLAAPARADPPDADFLAALDSAGITYRSGPDAIAIARRACQLMDQGHAEGDVITAMSAQNTGFTDSAAAQFTQIAERVYCPQHVGGVVTPPASPPPPAPWFDFPLPPLPAAM